MQNYTALEVIEKVKNDYDDIADEFSATRKSVWSDILFINNYVKDGDRVLDLGCGNGRLLKLLKEKKITYTGIDISEKIIRQAQSEFNENDQTKFLVGNALELPFDDNEFDVVISVAFFHHIPSNELRLKTLKEVRRVTGNNGVIIMTVWNLWQKKYLKFIMKNIFMKFIGLSNLDFKDALIPWKKGKNVDRYYHAFTLSELRKLVNGSLLKLVDLGYTIRDKKRPNLFFIAKKIDLKV